MSLRTPLELGLAAYMGRFKDALVADTPAMEEFVARSLAQSIVWAPGRMIDQVEEMLTEWRKNDNTGSPGLSAMLPVIVLCVSKDFSYAPPEWGLALGSPIDFVIPEDTAGRAFKVRMSANEYRAQAVIFSPEAQTGHSISMQFNLFANGPGNRRFSYVHPFAGFDHTFKAVFENIDLGAIAAPTDVHNLTIDIVDLSIRAMIPIFSAPKPGEPNDGSTVKPAGYPVVVETNTFAHDSQRRNTAAIDPAGVVTTFNGVDPAIKMFDPDGATVNLDTPPDATP